jgi:hypothetical protein
MAAHGVFGRIGLARCRPGIGLPQKKDIYNALASDRTFPIKQKASLARARLLILRRRRVCLDGQS